MIRLLLNFLTFEKDQTRVTLDFFVVYSTVAQITLHENRKKLQTKVHLMSLKYAKDSPFRWQKLNFAHVFHVKECNFQTMPAVVVKYNG